MTPVSFGIPAERVSEGQAPFAAPNGAYGKPEVVLAGDRQKALDSSRWVCPGKSVQITVQLGLASLQTCPNDCGCLRGDSCKVVALGLVTTPVRRAGEMTRVQALDCANVAPAKTSTPRWDRARNMQIYAAI